MSERVPSTASYDGQDLGRWLICCLHNPDQTGSCPSIIDTTCKRCGRQAGYTTFV